MRLRILGLVGLRTTPERRMENIMAISMVMLEMSLYINWVNFAELGVKEDDGWVIDCCAGKERDTCIRLRCCGLFPFELVMNYNNIAYSVVLLITSRLFDIFITLLVTILSVASNTCYCLVQRFLVNPRYSDPLCTATLSLHPRKPRSRYSLCNFKGSPRQSATPAGRHPI